jgi:hypothetical protein
MLAHLITIPHGVMENAGRRRRKKGAIMAGWTSEL